MYSDWVVTVGIAGASGYLGAELMRLCVGHPDFDIRVVTGDTQAGTKVGDLYPSLRAAMPDAVFEPLDASTFDGLDLAFLALPHGQSQQLVPELRKRVGVIVDLAADFRLKDPALYPTWYGEEHLHPELLNDAAFGLPELYRDNLAGSTLIAAAGCYVTAASLALAPLVRSGLLEPSGIVIDAASGVSGAGRALKHSSLYGTVNEDFTAYGLLNHRHTPEIEQTIGAQVLFTPHLAPMTRGILATCYARPAPGRNEDPLDLLAAAYEGETFIVVSDAVPSTKATLGSNTAHLTARRDPRTGWVIVIAALDNLVKGGSGQGVQSANIALGLPEGAGLPLTGLYP